MTASQDTGVVRHQSILGDTRYEKYRVTIYLCLTCRDVSFRSVSGFPLIFNKIFGNQMCQTWSKQVEN